MGLDREAPIGIFDSGVGGLTVARAVLDQLPDESIYYVGDTLRGPYGPRPIAEVRGIALDIMDHLVTEGVKALVIACNSASAAVLRDARERYDVPVVEVIQPAVRRAVAARLGCFPKQNLLKSVFDIHKSRTKTWKKKRHVAQMCHVTPPCMPGMHGGVV